MPFDVCKCYEYNVFSGKNCISRAKCIAVLFIPGFGGCNIVCRCLFNTVCRHSRHNYYETRAMYRGISTLDEYSVFFKCLYTVWVTI